MSATRRTWTSTRRRRVGRRPARRTPRDRRLALRTKEAASEAASQVPYWTRRLVARSLLDVGLAAGAVDAAPRRPEDHREDEAERTDHHQNYADRLQLETRDGCVYCPGQDRSYCNQENAHSEAHSSSSLFIFAGCRVDRVRSSIKRSKRDFGYGPGGIRRHFRPCNWGGKHQVVSPRCAGARSSASR